MYYWLLELQALCLRIDNNTTVALAEQGATEENLLALESILCIPLPKSYRQFLSQWNGGEIMGSHILSTEEVHHWAEQAGFAPFAGDREATLKPPHKYYEYKPAYHLVFRNYEFQGDAFCFDTRILNTEDYPVCRYDVEFELEDHLKVRYSSFEIMILSEIRDVAVDGTILMDARNPLSDEEETEIDQELNQFGERLTSLLLERGAH